MHEKLNLCCYNNRKSLKNYHLKKYINNIIKLPLVIYFLYS